MGIVDDVLKRFNAVKHGDSDSFIFTIARPDGVPIPPGENAEAHSGLFSWDLDFVLEGLQRRKDGSFVLTGGSSGSRGDSYNNISDIYAGGYAYVTTALSSTACAIAAVVYPQAVASGFIAYPSPTDDPKHTSPVYLLNNHLGGCQVVADEEGELLVVGYGRLNDEDGSNGTSTILFYRLDSLDAQGRPRELSNLSFVRLAAGNNSANAVGLTRTVGPDGAPTGWLLVVANYEAERLDFYTSRAARLDENSEASDRFEEAGSWSSSQKLFTTIKDTSWEEYRNVSLFTQSDGSLWLIGTHMDNDDNDDWADLYSLYNPDLQGTTWGAWALGHSPSPPQGWSLTKRGKMHFTRRKGYTYNDDGPRFDFGSGYYYNDATKCFEVYACEDRLSGSRRNEIQCSRWMGTPEKSA